MIYLLLGGMAAVIAVLAVRLHLMKQSAREITEDLSKIIRDDTNTGLRISSRDKEMRALADSINTQLRLLRQEHLQYHQGNTELKNAITNISHDLRTPLTAICGYLDMLQKTDDPAKIARYLEILRERTEMMKQLTEELFRYSIIATNETENETETVFVNQLLAESIGSFYPALTARGITPEITITETRIERNVNRAELARVFANLLNNAVKYSDGDLSISLSDAGEITFSNTARELTGVDAEQLFGRFYTVETAHHSTGLGLSIARTLIERMNGTISAEYNNNRITILIRL